MRCSVLALKLVKVEQSAGKHTHRFYRVSFIITVKNSNSFFLKVNTLADFIKFDAKDL